MLDFSQLKICFLAGTLGQGGAERQLFLTCTLLKNRGASVHVLSLTRGEFWEQPLREAGIPVIWVGSAKSKLLRILAIRKQLKALKPQICQSQHFFANLYAALACKGLPVKSIGAVRSDLHQEMASRSPWLCRRSLTWPERIFANSKQAISNASHYGISSERFRYSPNILPIEDFPTIKPSVQKVYRILGVGRMVKLKNWTLFLKILAELRRRGIAVTGTLVGDGPEKKALMSYAQTLRLLPEGVSFTGPVSDVRPHYALADLLLLTSDLEGTPNVIMEAMACGLPVVSTRAGGVVELIKNGVNGCLADVGDAAGLRDHCIQLLSNYERRRDLGRAARLTIKEGFAPEAVAKLYQLNYEDLLQ